MPARLSNLLAGFAKARIPVLLAPTLVAVGCTGDTTHGSSAATGGEPAAGAAGALASAGGGAPVRAGAGGIALGSAGSSGVGLGGRGDAGGHGPAVAGGGPESLVRSCKRGVSVNEVSLADMTALSSSVGWFYDWAPGVPGRLEGQLAEAGMEFVPMVWGAGFTVEEIVATIPPGARYLLGFNEPNFKVGQANLSAADAAALWPMLEEVAAARELEIVGPAVNYCGPESACWDTDPFSYLDDFFAACSGCRVDYLAVHWYDCSSDGLQWFVDQAKVYGKPLWLTEFNCPNGDAAQQLAYLRQAVPILEADPMVFRYAWLMARSTVPAINLLAGDGELTALGEAYLALPPGADCP